MRGTDELHHLILSLTPAEKRMFTIHARRHMDDPHYLDLFDALAEMNTYDEDTIRTRFAGTMVDKHYAVVRHHLLAEILTCLHRMPAERGAISTLHHEIDGVNFLLSRGCTATAERRLRRALAIAHRFELPAFIVDLCAIQRRTLLGTPRVQRAILDEEHTALTALQDLHDATRMFDIADRLNAERLLGADVAIPDDLPRHATSLTHVARLRRERALWRMALIIHDPDRTRTHLHGALQTLRDMIDIADAHLADVIDVLLDVADEASLQGAHDIMSAALDHCIEIIDHTETSPASVRLLRIVEDHIRVALAVHADGDMCEADVLTIRRDDDVRRHLPRRATYAWSIRSAALALANDDPTLALERVNELLQDTTMRSLAPRWYGQLLLLNVTVHDALGNREYLPYCVRGTLRKNERRFLLTKEECRVVRSIGTGTLARVVTAGLEIPMSPILRARCSRSSMADADDQHLRRQRAA
jgi:hypothetical protein